MVGQMVVGSARSSARRVGGVGGRRGGIVRTLSVSSPVGLVVSSSEAMVLRGAKRCAAKRCGRCVGVVTSNVLFSSKGV